MCYRLKIFVNCDYKFNTCCRSQCLFVLKAKKGLGELLLRSLPRGRDLCRVDLHSLALGARVPCISPERAVLADVLVQLKG